MKRASAAWKKVGLRTTQSFEVRLAGQALAVASGLSRGARQPIPPDPANLWLSFGFRIRASNVCSCLTDHKPNSRACFTGNTLRPRGLARLTSEVRAVVTVSVHGRSISLRLQSRFDRALGGLGAPVPLRASLRVVEPYCSRSRWNFNCVALKDANRLAISSRSFFGGRETTRSNFGGLKSLGGSDRKLCSVYTIGTI